MSKKSIVVFGGSGFLGSHVADELTLAGYAVKIFDTVKSPWSSEKQEMIVGDILDLEAIKKVTAGAHAVYNFAALSDINEALSQPLKTININILGNGNILEACRLNNVKRYIYASTVYVFSREGGFYRCSKQAAESYVEEYQSLFGLDYTILRYGSLYGPRADAKNGLYNVVKKALETGLIHYQGNADSLREYIHVQDAAKASVVSLGDDFCNQSVTLTGQEPMRVQDLLKMLAEILGLKDQVHFENKDYVGHYVRTPYAYQSKLGRKYISPMHIDLGQGLLQLINEVKNSGAKIQEKFK